MGRKIEYIADKTELLEILKKYKIPVKEEEFRHPFPILYPRKYVLRILSRAQDDKSKLQAKNILLCPKVEVWEEPSNGVKFSFFTEETKDSNPLKGLTRAYPDRVLVSPVGQCAINCAWCFRARQKGMLTVEEIERILNYIKNDMRIEDVIITGGEPFLFPMERLREFLARLRTISHVRIIRFHTRLPIVAPEFFDDKIINMIGEFNKPGYPIYLVVHIVHPLEIDEEVTQLIYKFALQGITTFNQAPVLKGINDDQETFNRWLKSMIHAGIKPYYVAVPVIRFGFNDPYFVPYSKITELVAEYSSWYDGLGRPTIIIPIMGKKISPLELKELMIKNQGIHLRNTKAEIW